MITDMEPLITTFHVTGMTCGHCVAAVSAELAKINAVSAVDVELSTGLVTVTSTAPIDIDAVLAAVDEAGYELAT
jgi:copper chaperone